jgi:hypothetical protein
MKRILVAVGGALALGLSGATSAHAQSCTDELGAGLSYCIEQGVDSCAAAVKECSSSDYSVTLDDVWMESIKTCCKKKNKPTRKACLSGFRRKLKTTGKVASLGAFLRTAKKKTSDLIKNDCYNGAYSSLF